MRGRLFVPILLLCTFAAIPLAGQDAERILLFRSAISVHQDSTVTVHETITVTATGEKIKHGIYRDFPTHYRDDNGRMVEVRFDVSSVARDGSQEPYRVVGGPDSQRLYIGDPKKLVKNGPHTYTLTYEGNWVLGFFTDHDELYWNVTGTGWRFPIDKAIAIVTLPRLVSKPDLKLDAYTGPKGSRDKNYEAHVDGSGRAVFTTTNPLARQEGLTIVVGWPKGIVTDPAKGEVRSPFQPDDRSDSHQWPQQSATDPAHGFMHTPFGLVSRQMMFVVVGGGLIVLGLVGASVRLLLVRPGRRARW